MPIKYGSMSPYYRTPTKEFYLDVYVDRPIPPDPDDIVIELETRHTHRPDLLSYDLYGTTKYWWVFIRRNRDRIKDPIYDMEPGLQIFVPVKSRLEDLIN